MNSRWLPLSWAGLTLAGLAGCKNLADLPGELGAQNDSMLATIPPGQVVNTTFFVEADADERVPDAREGAIGIIEIGAREPSGAAVEFGLECRDIAPDNETEFEARDPLALPYGYVSYTGYSGARFPIRFVCGVTLSGSSPREGEPIRLTWKATADVRVAPEDDARISVYLDPG